MQERYGIADDDLVGEVLWHSLNESGEIGVYDMKFGNTIVRNLLAEDIKTEEEKLHDALYDIQMCFKIFLELKKNMNL